MDLSVHLDVVSLWLGAGLGILGLFVVVGIGGAIANSAKARKRKQFLNRLPSFADIDWDFEKTPEPPKAKPKPKKPAPGKDK